MKDFFKSKMVLVVITFILLAAAVALPLSGNITKSHAASAVSHVSHTQSLQSHTKTSASLSWPCWWPLINDCSFQVEFFCPSMTWATVTGTNQYGVTTTWNSRYNAYLNTSTNMLFTLNWWWKDGSTVTIHTNYLGWTSRTTWYMTVYNYNGQGYGVGSCS